MQIVLLFPPQMFASEGTCFYFDSTTQTSSGRSPNGPKLELHKRFLLLFFSFFFGSLIFW